MNKPFNLEAAKAGAKPIYRNGQSPRGLFVNLESQSAFPLLSVDNNSEFHYHTIDGHSHIHGKHLDLFLQTKRTVYAPVFKYSDGTNVEIAAKRVFDTIVDAHRYVESQSSHSCAFIGVISGEIEE